MAKKDEAQDEADRQVPRQVPSATAGQDAPAPAQDDPGKEPAPAGNGGGKKAKGPQGGSADNPVYMATVAAPPAPINVAAPGAALTPGQITGTDPVDPKKDLEEHGRRDELPNRQTTFESERAVDPVSGTPSPGITLEDGVGLTGVTQGQTPTDMSGRRAVSKDDRNTFNVVREALSKAQEEDGPNNDVQPSLKGGRTPAQLRVPGGALRRLVEAGAPLRFEEVPNGHNFPETGRRYFLK